MCASPAHEEKGIPVCPCGWLTRPIWAMSHFSWIFGDVICVKKGCERGYTGASHHQSLLSPLTPLRAIVRHTAYMWPHRKEWDHPDPNSGRNIFITSQMTKTCVLLGAMVGDSHPVPCSLLWRELLLSLVTDLDAALTKLMPAWRVECPVCTLCPPTSHREDLFTEYYCLAWSARQSRK